MMSTPPQQNGTASTDRLRIAVFRALFLGDMLCIIPAVRAIRHYYPNAIITLIGLSWQRDLMERFASYFDEFIEFPGWPGLPEKDFDPAQVVEFLREMQRKQFDIVFQMQGNGELTNSMCLLWGGRRTVGLRKPQDIPLLENCFPVSSDDEHEVTRFLKLLDILGIPRKGNHLEFPLTDKEEENFVEMDRLAGLSLREYVCLHPGARDPKRRWPAENFAWVGDRLAEHGLAVVITGSDAEKDVIEKVKSHMKVTPVDAVEQFAPLHLGKLAAIIKYAKLLVSNDTGVSHISAGLAVPSVIIFSPYSRLSRWAPEDPVLHRVITPEQSMNVDLVWSQIQHQLQIRVPIAGPSK
jgi:ADP-heptose:LPS heptosyltransferase